MTDIASPPAAPDAAAPDAAGSGTPVARTRRPASRRMIQGLVSKPALPVWLRRPPKRAREARPSPSPKDVRWWAGVVWLLASALALGFVAHVVVVGSLQHWREQYVMYQELRTELALATAPLGQLDVDQALVTNGTPIGLLTIKSIGVNEVMVQGTSPNDLMAGPGHRRDTVMPGQAGTSVVMGRQGTYGGPFGALATVSIGDKITVVTGQGTSEYAVFSVRREGDLLPEPLGSGEGRLELITADGIPLAPSGAIHVDAELTTEVNETPTPVFTKEVLSPSELAMGGDPGGWFATLFWFQWLAAAVIGVRWVRGRSGAWQTWVLGIPVLLALGAATAGAAMSMLPNLL